MNTDRCLSCQYEDTWKNTGSFPSEQAARHWSMWGCTCDDTTETEALAFIDQVTR